AELRIAQFWAEPLTAFAPRDALFPVVAEPLSHQHPHAILPRIKQLSHDLHGGPHSFPLNATHGLGDGRLAERNLAKRRTDLARPVVLQAAGIRDALVAGDGKSPVVLNFKHRVDALEILAGPL